ncbi:penicillin-binding protein [Chungangia koreensis]|uniref:Penicillin-binding protein n=2 Tax=Chungangia koreensis TaxID=752657 RepID=A0ABV8X2G6_9LACT
MFLLYGGLFFVLFVRMFLIQATGEAEGQALAALADKKYSRETTLSASRGVIYDQSGETIAKDTLSYRLIAILSPQATNDVEHPRHVVDPEKTAQVLAEYIPLSEEEIFERLSMNGKYQVEFGKAGRDISHDTMLKIQQEGLPGIVFERDLKRLYPNGKFASHLIGFALKEENEEGKVTTNGKMGLERTYNEELTGKDGKLSYKSDLWGYLLPNKEQILTPAQNGQDIYLTLDKTIQSFLEDAMNRVETEYEPAKMVAIVADPKTGAILAMSQRPSFNPQTLDGLTSNWLNDAVENTIEPGSTMKIITLAAAIEEGKWNPGATYQSGRYKLLDQTIRDHNGGNGWGRITYLEGFQRSSNVAMAYLLENLGDRTFIEYVRKFGFGGKTGIDLPNEATGTILDNWPSERLTTSFGQGTTVTPIQMIQAGTAIANDGKMMEPYIIDKIVDPNTEEIVKDNEPSEKAKPISSKTAEEVRKIMASTVTAEKGTAKRFALDGYTVAGKTGTAQIPDPKTGNYLWGKNDFLYSFLGMAPAEDPELLVYIAVQQPQLKVTEIGSQPVAEIFTSVTENSLKYLSIEPSSDIKVEKTSLGDYEGKESQAVIQELKNTGLVPVVVGDGGKITEQYPAKKTEILKGQRVFLKTEGQATLPDFTGWSKRNVLIFKEMSGLRIETSGEGFVHSQSVSAGNIASGNSPVVLKLQTPAEVYNNMNSENEENSLPQD